MYVKFQGTISGDTTSGDAICGIAFCCRTGSDYTKSIAYYVTAAASGTNYTSTSSNNVVTQTEVDVITAAFEGNGFVASIGTLASGTTYVPCVKLCESRTGGLYVWGNWVDCTSSTPSTFTYTSLSAPTIGTATASTKTLTWSAVSNAVGYQIAISTDSGSTYPTTQIVGAVTSNVFTAMTASTYRYKVAAIDTYGTLSAYSSVATAA